MRIQLHEQFTVVVDGSAVERLLPGRRGRMLVAFLAAESQPVGRERLMETVWQPERPGETATRVFNPLLSRVRTVLGPAQIRGREVLQLVLPDGALVDSVRARTALHDAEAAAGAGDWRRAWAQALSAMFVTQREFLPGVDTEWVARRRDEARAAHIAAMACYAEACLELGGSELPAAERTARSLVDADPVGERGHRLLMQAMTRRGDRAAALAAFGRLRCLLREELGVGPGRQSTDLYRRLLDDGI
ncbi:BTAD domain-containing putative transcriptional regulator [Pseudonocardia tropica]|uniref:BTAD domain-containing putative transcriptional regulator n=1 Tax=Pseudonocardia tropica TaxID=681289 RepID=A0ABV1JVG1_9PSEU